MSEKTIKGAVFKDWYDNHFPVGYFIDAIEFIEDTHDSENQWLVPDDLDIPLSECGYLQWDEDLSEDGSKIEKRHRIFGDSTSTASAIRRWLKTAEFEPILVHVPRGRVGEFKAFVKDIGGQLK